MRVITGSAKGIRLITCDGLDVRPTTDRVKEGIFSSIQFELEQAAVLDLFAGSGQLGIEALSRGAAHCDFVDASSESLGVVRKNLSATRLSEKAMLHLCNAQSFLKSCNSMYSFVFLDPPYKKGLLQEVLPLVSEHTVCGAKVFAECPFDDELSESYGSLKLVRKYRYGKIFVFMYQNGLS